MTEGAIPFLSVSDGKPDSFERYSVASSALGGNGTSAIAESRRSTANGGLPYFSPSPVCFNVL